jgi:hypothetical protein
VLVTLWKLNDGEARDFMVKKWLNQVHSDPTKALRDTQLFYEFESYMPSQAV